MLPRSAKYDIALHPDDMFGSELNRLTKFYEKLGYKKTGKTEIINDRLTLVFYEKD